MGGGAVGGGAVGSGAVGGGAVGGGAVGDGAVGGGAVWKGNTIGRIGSGRGPDPISCGHAANESVHSCTALIFTIKNSSLK